MSIAYISDLERGNLSNPSLSTLSRVATALNVTVDSLLGEAEASRAPEEPDAPQELERFINGPVFQAAVKELSVAWKVDEADLVRDWRSALGAVLVAGRSPQRETDWHFVFEAIRRAVER